MTASRPSSAAGVRAAGLLAATLALPLALAPARARAQAPSVPIRVGVIAGASFPTGTTGDRYDTGFNVDGVLEVTPPLSPLGFRAEVGYASFAGKRVSGVNVRDLRMISGVGNVILRFAPAATTVRPYLIGGVGLYNVKAKGADDSANKVGFNGGVGLEIPLTGITGFGEVRYHSVQTAGSAFTFVPLRFGVRF